MNHQPLGINHSIGGQFHAGEPRHLQRHPGGGENRGLAVVPGVPPQRCQPYNQGGPYGGGIMLMVMRLMM